MIPTEGQPFPLLGVPEMDQTHEAFVQHIALVETAADADVLVTTMDSTLMIVPSLMIATRSQSLWTSERMCDENKTVAPFWSSSRMRWKNCCWMRLPIM